MASLPYPLNRQYYHVRVGMAGMPYPPTDCRSYIKINMNTYLAQLVECQVVALVVMGSIPIKLPNASIAQW